MLINLKKESCNNYSVISLLGIENVFFMRDQGESMDNGYTEPDVNLRGRFGRHCKNIASKTIDVVVQYLTLNMLKSCTSVKRFGWNGNMIIYMHQDNLMWYNNPLTIMFTLLTNDYGIFFYLYDRAKNKELATKQARYVVNIDPSVNPKSTSGRKKLQQLFKIIYRENLTENVIHNTWLYHAENQHTMKHFKTFGDFRAND